jgi:predicted chitinase
MNIHELDSFKLTDAVKFHNRLNPVIWARDENMLPEVRDKLLEIAADFREFLGVSDLQVKDITVSGSNAAFSYTPQSDIDLHLVVEFPSHDDVYQELFNAKKYQYNDEHTLSIGKIPVELYVQNAAEAPVSQGEYSVMHDRWIQVPRKKRARIDDTCVRAKVEDLDARIHSAIQSGDPDAMGRLWDKIRNMRQSGLDQHGEFGCENIVFKILRTKGCIKALRDARTAARDHELSLREQNKPRQRFRYGFSEDAGSTPDGVSPSTKMFCEDDLDPDTINDFIQHVASELGIDPLPRVVLHTDPDWGTSNHSFGRYDPEAHTLNVSLTNRHILDVLRTVAHELVHCAQHQTHPLPPDAGETGSRWENDANARAGIIMRDWANTHPEQFDDAPIKESASGYIPTAKEKNDPRYSMALTVDIKPGQIGKEANKMKLNTDSQGKPALLMKTINQLSEEFDKFKKSQGKEEPWDRDGYEPPGPEFPPEMPAGTTKVDVSDLTDWYRLGQDISDMDDAQPADYNQGPPQTVITFASDELEQQYLKQFKRLGLKTHDMDPDVEGGEDTTGKHMKELAEEFDLLEQEFLGEIKMSPSNLRAEAAKTGAIAGMEFEMIVPNTENDDGDLEPDYDQDERCRSIDDAVAFFHDGDYNGRREVERLRERMQNDFQEWLDDKLYRDWERSGEEFLEEWVPNNVDESEWNPDGLEGEARTEALEEYIANLHSDPGSSDAFDEFREDNYGSYDESDWLDAEDLDRMSGVENAYEISWPHWTTNGGEASIEDVAGDFESAIGRTTRASGSYHSGRVPRPGPNALHYVVEPDGSLDGDNSGDTGLEFVSPPLPIDEILSDLNQVKAWAKEYGCYTNDSTGLHINISVPDYSRENLDFVKLALLLGDKYVLDSFGRAGNTYAKSALDMVRDRVRNNPEDAAQLLNKMKGNLDSLASKAIHSGVTSKYTSINTKDGHIEFRSPGGDWLDENFDQIENTLLRFTVAMSAALNPAAYREEYLKKLYKLLTENNKDDADTIRYFSEYVAGKIPKAALRSFVKQAQLTRQVKRGATSGKKMWWSVTNPPQSLAGIEVVATSKEEAIEKALGADGYPSWANTRQSVVAKPVRPYEEPPAQDTSSATTGNWGIWVAVLDRFATMNVDGESVTRRFGDQASARAWIQDYNIRNPGNDLELTVQEIEPAAPETQGVDTTVDYEIYNRETGEVVDTAQLRNDDEARIRLDDYRAHGPHRLNRQQAEQTFGIRRGPGPGPWEVASRTNNQVYFNPPSTYRRNAESEARTWLSQNGHNPNDFEVRTRQTGQDSSQSGIIDVEPDIEVVYPGSTAALAQQRATPGTFTGAWKILDADGNELYRFSGIGNQQRDANRVATQWMQNNGYAYGTEMSVVPIMTEDELDEGVVDWAKRGAAAAAIAAGTLGAPQAATAAMSAPTASTMQVKAPTAQVKAPTAQVKAPVAAGSAEKTLEQTAKRSGLRGTELAQFMAQCAHETAGFSTLIEKGGSLDFRKYDPKFAPAKARALGNTQVGDGGKYRGRGFIQITGRYNYKKAGEALGLPLEQQPELAARPDVAAKIAVWYWQSRVQPRVQDFADTRQVTKQINPGLAGLQDRIATFKDYQVGPA